jgi:hypothetical protein
VSFIHLNFCLKLTLKCSEARVVLQVGKNRDRYFSCEDLLKQVEHSIDIFESKAIAQVASQQGCLLLTMLQVIKSARPMLCLLTRCPKIQTKTGLTRKMVQECETANLVPVAPRKTSIFPKIMPLCQAGLKAWKSSFANGAFGRWQACRLNAMVLNVKLARRIAAADALCFPSLISWLRNHILKSMSLREVTFVTST